MRSILLTLLLCGTAVSAEAPIEAVLLAEKDAASLPQEIAFQRRYIYCPNHSRDEVAAAIYLINSVFSQVAFDVKPPVLFDNRLVVVDLKILAPKAEDFVRLRKEWAELAVDEPYFHERVKAKKVSVKPYVAVDGKTYDHKYEDVFISANHLGKNGFALQALTGNVIPNEASVCPIVRVDWLIGRALSTVDGGQYYDFRGLKVGETTLDDYLKDRGYNPSAARPEDRAAMLSLVTGKARGTTFIQGGGAKPSTGTALAVITDDPFDDNDDPQANAFRTLIDNKPDGHEVMITLPNGWIEFTLFDGQGKLAAEAPPNLVQDHRQPEPFHGRLQGAISCIRCHAPNDMWQPVINEVAVMIGDRPRILADLSSQDQNDVLSRIFEKYSGDVRPVIERARDDFDRRVFLSTGLPGKQVATFIGDTYTRYNKWVSAKEALFDMGFESQDELGIDTFRTTVPPLHPDGLILDDPIIGRYHVRFLDEDTGQQRGLMNTRREWEIVFPVAMYRALPKLKEKKK